MTAHTSATATIAIVTDGSADIPATERDAVVSGSDHVSWHVIPEIWLSGSIDVRDNGEASIELVRQVLSDSPPDPVEPGFRDYCKAFDQLRDVDRVFVLTGPHHISTASESAREAAGGFPNVRVVEVGSIGIGIGLLGVRAAQMAIEGSTPDDVERWLRSHKDTVRMLLVPDRFDPMMGQRRAAAMLLSGRPILHSTGAGQLDSSRRLRSRRATVSAIERYFEDHAGSDAVIRLAVGHGDAPGAVDPFLDILERCRPLNVDVVGRVGPRLVEQLGTRCVVAAWLEEEAT